MMNILLKNNLIFQVKKEVVEEKLLSEKKTEMSQKKLIKRLPIGDARLHYYKIYFYITDI